MYDVLILFYLFKIWLIQILVLIKGIQTIKLKSITFYRARVKAGMRILGATATSDEWNVSVEKENPKHTVARVTAFRKDRDPDSTVKDNTDDTNSNK